ncbi:MAG: hypothetical protein JST63_02170 [Bacteroidetes bacterium]|nr:hypothetical protein [Bacteroidota bacterium]
MTKILLSFFLCIIFSTPGYNQDSKGISGIYFLRDVKDVSSAFNLKANYSFTFFYTIGNLTRTGSGRWSLENNSIIFSGRQQPPRPFKLFQGKKVNDNYITIQFTDENPDYIKDIQCILFTARGRQSIFTNKDGIAKFTKQEIDSIQVSSPLFPDKPYTFIPLNKIQNSFEFEFEKWIPEVFFNDFILSYAGNTLFGKHPVIAGNSFRYVKGN